MTKKTLMVKSGDTWEYEETPELLAALAKLHGTTTKLATPLQEKPKRKLKPQAMRARRESLRHFKNRHMTPPKKRGSFV